MHWNNSHKKINSVYRLSSPNESHTMHSGNDLDTNHKKVDRRKHSGPLSALWRGLKRFFSKIVSSSAGLRKETVMIPTDNGDDNPNPWQWAQKVFNPEDFNELINTTGQVFDEASELIKLELALTKSDVVNLVQRWRLACNDDGDAQDFFADMMAAWMAWLEDMLDEYHPDWDSEEEE